MRSLWSGDSGALIVDACCRFVALLTGGTSRGTDSSDISFATPIKGKFPGASLYFDDLEHFFGDVV